MNIEEIDSLKLANSIPSENDKANMVAKLVCETADMQRRIENLLIENTEWKLENERLHSIIKEVREYVEKYEVINGYYDSNYDGENDTYSHDLVKEDILEILDKVSK